MSQILRNDGFLVLIIVANKYGKLCQKMLIAFFCNKIEPRTSSFFQRMIEIKSGGIQSQKLTPKKREEKNLLCKFQTAFHPKILPSIFGTNTLRGAQTNKQTSR